jgi:hypothetical protein
MPVQAWRHLEAQQRDGAPAARDALMVRTPAGIGPAVAAGLDSNGDSNGRGRGGMRGNGSWTRTDAQ